MRTARRHAWPILAVSIVLSAVTVAAELAGPTDVVTTLVVRSAGEGVVEAAVGLLLVELCYRLIAAERAAARSAAQPVGLADRAYLMATAGASRA